MIILVIREQPLQRNTSLVRPKGTQVLLTRNKSPPPPTRKATWVDLTAKGGGGIQTNKGEIKRWGGDVESLLGVPFGSNLTLAMTKK